MRGGDLLDRVDAGGLIDGGTTIDDLLAYGHGGGYGMTGAGKTSALRWLHASTRMVSIAFNVEDEPMPGARVTSPRELHKALSEGARRINYVPPESDLERVAHLEAVRVILFSVGDAMRRRRGGRAAPTWCVLHIDECHTVARKSDRDGPVHRLLKLARKRGVVVWCWSQEPSEVAHICLTQPRVLMLWRVQAFRVPYLEEYGLPMTEIWEHVQQPFHAAVVVDNRLALVPPLPQVS